MLLNKKSYSNSETTSGHTHIHTKENDHDKHNHHDNHNNHDDNHST